MAELSQQQRIASLQTPLGEDALVLTRFSGTEALGELFEFQVEAYSEHANVDFDKGLGQHCTVKFEAYGSKRLFDGILVEAQWLGPRNVYHYYRLTLRPWLWLASRKADCRIFQNEAVPDIIRKVLSDYGEPLELQVQGPFKPLEYCVQYRETDFNFVSRLMEQNGIYYYFKHEEKTHTCVLVDAPSAHKPIPGHATVPYLPLTDATRGERHALREWSTQRQFRSGKFALTDYDFKKPKTDLSADKEASEAYRSSKLEVYDYPGKYIERGEGRTFATIRLQAEQAFDRRSYGSGDADILYPGGLIKLDPKPDGLGEVDYLILRCSHSFSAQDYRSGAAADESYYGHYEFLPRARPFRSPIVTPKPVIPGLQTAEVVGKSGEEIDVDEHGRIVVQFHWDREGKRDEKSSCRIRVAQPWSHGQWGWQVIPRIGQEVLVQFEEGDPDRPLAIGTVYNGDNKVPYQLPANKTQSGVKSNSSKGGRGYNEFMFEDKKGSEKIRMHAQKDHEIVVLNNTSRSIGNNLTTKVSNSEKRTIGEKFKPPTGSTSLATTIENGDVELNVKSGTLKYEAKLKMEFIVGPSKITIDPTGITLDAPTITIKAATTCVIQGLPVKIN